MAEVYGDEKKEEKKEEKKDEKKGKDEPSEGGDDDDDDDEPDDDSGDENITYPITITLVFENEEIPMVLPGDAVSGLAITWFVSLRGGNTLQPREYRLRPLAGGVMLGWNEPVEDGARYDVELVGLRGGAISL